MRLFIVTSLLFESLRLCFLVDLFTPMGELI
ncbi:hypothetical protein NITLEN_30360 [Nitrospira lenta]|uniref:Uncharacterized protein n=1 Tax=Nitrospira lenta TaxID=1436998 RepID=A0A330L8Y8_9BACT|nr:hypothetical protein NITLEN_30360 [Nitrospira lenta]